MGWSIGWRRRNLMRRVVEAGLRVATHSPGDGVTRYRFFKSKKRVSYFTHVGIYTALGLTEAEAWLAGYMRGKF